jgi:hypothetical protein
MFDLEGILMGFKGRDVAKDTLYKWELAFSCDGCSYKYPLSQVSQVGHVSLGQYSRRAMPRNIDALPLLIVNAAPGRGKHQGALRPPGTGWFIWLVSAPLRNAFRVGLFNFFAFKFAHFFIQLIFFS